MTTSTESGSGSIAFLDKGGTLPDTLPASEAVAYAGVLYLSGQIGNRPGTLELVPGGIRAEARQALQNVRRVLAANGLGEADLLKCTVMLADIGEWPAFNEVWRDVLRPPYPARSALATSGLALGARVEIDAIAALHGGADRG
jgi:reactive intermediate/imine deaminase